MPVQLQVSVCEGDPSASSSVSAIPTCLKLYRTFPTDIAAIRPGQASFPAFTFDVKMAWGLGEGVFDARFRGPSRVLSLLSSPCYSRIPTLPCEYSMNSPVYPTGYTVFRWKKRKTPLEKNQNAFQGRGPVPCSPAANSRNLILLRSAGF